MALTIMAINRANNKIQIPSERGVRAAERTKADEATMVDSKISIWK